MADEQMVDDSVAEIRGPDLAELRIGNGEANGGAWLVTMAFQFTAQFQELRFKMHFKLCRMIGGPFVLPTMQICRIKIFKGEKIFARPESFSLES